MVNVLTDKILVKIRPALDKDIKTLSNIDNYLKNSGWKPEDFKYFKKKPDNISLVADIGTTPVGYILFTLNKTKIKIERLTVTEALHRHSIGSQLLDRARHGYLKLSRGCIYVELNEYNLPAQLFFQKHGFRANEIINEYGTETYKMEYFKP